MQKRLVLGRGVKILDQKTRGGFKGLRRILIKKNKDKQQKTKTKNMRGFRNFEGDGGCRTSGIRGSVSELND